MKLNLKERLKSLKNIDLDLLDALSLALALASTADEGSSVVRGADWVGEEDDSAWGVEDTSDGVELATVGGVEGSVEEAATGDSDSAAALETTASEAVEVPSELAAGVDETTSGEGAASDDAGTSGEVDTSVVDTSDEAGSNEVVGSADVAISEDASDEAASDEVVGSADEAGSEDTGASEEAKVEVEGAASLTAEDDA